MTKTHLAVAAAGLAAATLLVAGCTGGTDAGPSPTTELPHTASPSSSTEPSAAPSSTAPPSGAPESPAPDDGVVGTQVHFTAEDVLIEVTIEEDNAATRSFLEMLPITLEFTDLNGNEQYATPTGEFNYTGVPGANPMVGDLFSYRPWGNVGFFYDDSGNTYSDQLLTALVTPPRQLSFLSSDLHLGGDLKLDEVRSGGQITYRDSKLHMAMIATAAARLWPDRQVNAVAPGWVPTLMGFHDGNATTPDSLREGYLTQVWLAEGAQPGSDVTGEFLFHQQVETRVNKLVHDTQAQDHLLAAYAEQTGVTFPSGR